MASAVEEMKSVYSMSAGNEENVSISSQQQLYGENNGS